MKTNKIPENVNIYRANYNDSDSGKVFLTALIAPFLLSLLFSMIASTIANGSEIKAESITSSLGYIIAYCVCSFLINIAIFFVYNKTQKIEFKAIKPKYKMKWHTYLIIAGVGIISLFGIQYFIGMVDNLLKIIGFPLEEGLSTINPTSWGTYILAVVLLAILPAIGEELVFRGMILHGLRSRFKDAIAVVLSALMFALMHMNLQQLVYPFLLGIIMGWIVLRTGSLVSSILVHFINNFLVVTFSFVQNMTGFSLAMPNAWWAYVLTIGLLIVTALICFVIDKLYFKHKSEEKIEQTSVKISKFIYISLAVAGAMFLFLTIFSFVAGK